MRVLVTRPQADAAATAARLRAMGHSAVVAPLLDIHFRTGAPISLTGVQAVIATSANGIRALAQRTQARDIAVFTVGRQSAQAARDAGFRNVKSADGDARALAEKICVWARPDAGPLLHAAGRQTAGRLRQTLIARGYALCEEPLYDAVARDLSDNAAKALEKGALDTVLFYSPRSAQLFCEAVLQAGLAGFCGRLLAVCISDAAAAATAAITFGEIRVAVRPNENDLLARLLA